MKRQGLHNCTETFLVTLESILMMNQAIKVGGLAAELTFSVGDDCRSKLTCMSTVHWSYESRMPIILTRNRHLLSIQLLH